MIIGEVKRMFGAAIRNQRMRLHMSQEELADRAGLHRTYVSELNVARAISRSRRSTGWPVRRTGVSRTGQPVDRLERDIARATFNIGNVVR